jgi:hypothetical protein
VRFLKGVCYPHPARGPGRRRYNVSDAARRAHEEIGLQTIFLSHASADRPLALMIKELLYRALGETPALKVFCSSDVGDIEGGKKWFDQIMQNLKNPCVLRGHLFCTGTAYVESSVGVSECMGSCVAARSGSALPPLAPLGQGRNPSSSDEIATNSGVAPSHSLLGGVGGATVVLDHNDCLAVMFRASCPLGVHYQRGA